MQVSLFAILTSILVLPISTQWTNSKGQDEVWQKIVLGISGPILLGFAVLCFAWICAPMRVFIDQRKLLDDQLSNQKRRADWQRIGEKLLSHFNEADEIHAIHVGVQHDYDGADVKVEDWSRRVSIFLGENQMLRDKYGFETIPAPKLSDTASIEHKWRVLKATLENRRQNLRMILMRVGDRAGFDWIDDAENSDDDAS
jgi:hypothetical protein